MVIKPNIPICLFVIAILMRSQSERPTEKHVLPLLEIIKKLNYKVYKINYDEDNETYNLIKQRNTISSIERTLDEDPKIIEYKL